MKCAIDQLKKKYSFTYKDGFIIPRRQEDVPKILNDLSKFVQENGGVDFFHQEGGKIKIDKALASANRQIMAENVLAYPMGTNGSSLSQLRISGRFLPMANREIDALKAKLNTFYYQFQQRGDYDKAAQFKNTIEDLNDFQENLANDIYNNLFTEIINLGNELEALLANENADPSVLLTKAIPERILFLRKVLLSYNRDTNVDGHFERGNKGKIDIYLAFHEAINNHSSAETLRTQLADLLHKYEQTKYHILKRLLENEPVLKEAIASGRVTQEEAAKELEALLSGKADIDKLVGYTGGLRRSAGLLGQVFYDMVAQNELKERGVVAGKLDRLEQLWHKIKNYKVNKDLVWKKLLTADKLELRNFFTKEFFTRFYEWKAMSKLDAGAARKLHKQMLDVFDIRKSETVYNMVMNRLSNKQRQEFEGEFSVDAEYDQKLRDRFGDVVFDILARQAADNLYNFIQYSSQAIAAEIKNTNRVQAQNPFVFLNWLDGSDDVYSPYPTYIVHIPKESNSHYVDSELLDILNSRDHIDEIREFYKIAYDVLSNYTNPTFKSAGHNVPQLAIAVSAHVPLMEAIRQKGLMKGILAATKQAIARIVQPFTFSEHSIRYDEGRIKTTHPYSFLKARRKLGDEFTEHFGWMIDDNLFQGIYNATTLAHDIRYRIAVQLYFDLIDEVINRNENIPVLQEVLHMWGMTNIYGNKFAANYSPRKKNQTINNFLTKVLRRTTKLDPVQRELVKIMKEREDMDEEDMLEIEKSGRVVTPASIIHGFIHYTVKRVLYLNPIIGIANRDDGRFESRIVAASGRKGYTEKQYRNARYYMLGTNSLKYLAKIFPGIKRTKRMKRAETLLKFMQLLGTIENRDDEVARNARIKKVSTEIWDQVNNIAKEISIDNAEWKNQGEVALALMQNIYLRDKNGDLHPLFNGETGEFVYKPGTLELKEEFATEENIRMWQEFKINENDIENLKWYVRMKDAIQSTQGNYDNRDKTFMHAGLVSTILFVFKRFAPELFYNRFKQEKVNIINGAVDTEGRYSYIGKRYPALLVLMLSSKAILDLWAIAAYASMFRIGSMRKELLNFGLSAAGVIAALMYSMKTIKNTAINVKTNALLMLTGIMEVGARLANYPLELLSGTKIHIPDAVMDAIQQTNVRIAGISEQDAKMISELNQEVAQRLYRYAGLAVFAAMVNYLIMAMLSDMCKEQEGDEEKCKERMDYAQRILFTMLNYRRRLMDAQEMYFTPSGIAGLSNNIFTSFGRDMGKIAKTGFEWLLGEKEFEELHNEVMLRSPLGPPKFLIKVIQGKFPDEQVWFPDASERLLLFNSKDPEKRAKATGEKYRREMYKILKSKFGDTSDEYQYYKGLISKKFSKKKGETYIQALARLNDKYVETYNKVSKLNKRRVQERFKQIKEYRQQLKKAKTKAERLRIAKKIDKIKAELEL